MEWDIYYVSFTSLYHVWIGTTGTSCKVLARTGKLEAYKNLNHKPKKEINLMTEQSENSNNLWEKTFNKQVTMKN